MLLIFAYSGTTGELLAHDLGGVFKGDSVVLEADHRANGLFHTAFGFDDADFTTGDGSDLELLFLFLGGFGCLIFTFLGFFGLTIDLVVEVRVVG